MEKYETTIGLEIHAQLKTESKMFCSCSNVISSRAAGSQKEEKRRLKLEEPNTRVCPVCLGMPGSLPTANQKAIEWTILLGLALNAEIPTEFNFERKNYFYPDLPKAYQISSATKPPVEGGFLEIETREGKIKKARIHHIHLEEDAGKLVHEEGKEYSLVDLNRAGTPLMEIVTEPDLESPEEAKVFLQSLRGILRSLRISDADMEKGQMRCDANISLKKNGAKELGTKVEIKNINSFKMVERALQYEIERQTDLLESNNKIIQETRGWNDAKGKSISQRTKEESMDYRYFPEPDLPPVMVGKKGLLNIEELKKLIPELPKEKKERFISEYGLNENDAFMLSSDYELAYYFEKIVEAMPVKSLENTEILKRMAKKSASWLITELLGRLNKAKIELSESKVKPEYIAELVNLIEEGLISGKMAKDIFDEMFETGKNPTIIISEKGLEQISGGDELEKIVENVISSNQKVVEEYKNGKLQVIGFLVGQVMKETGGKANPKMIIDILLKKLNN